ncbi:MAG: thioredoxin family protein [Bacillota bacterium]
MRFEVYGPGCHRCHSTEQVIKQVLAEMNIRAEVVKISDIGVMVDKRILKTPAVYLDGRKVSEGKVPNKEDVKAWLSAQAGKEV